MDRHSFNSNMPAYSGRYNNNNSSYSQYSRSSSQSYDRNFNSPFQSQQRYSDSNISFQKPNNFSSQRSVWNTNITNSIPSLFSQPTINPNAWQSNQNPISGNNPAWINNRNNDNSQFWMNNKPNSWNGRSNYQNNSRNDRKRARNPPGSNANRNQSGEMKRFKKPSQSTEDNKSNWRRKRRRTRPTGNASPSTNKIKTDNDTSNTTKTQIEGTLVTITKKEFPLKRFTNKEAEELFAAFKSEAIKLDPNGALIKNVQTKKGSLHVVCKNEDGVEHVKTITETLTPWEGNNLRVTLPVIKGEEKLINVVTSNFPFDKFTSEQRELLEKALENQMNSIPEGEFYPEFLDYYKRGGTMLMVCNNEQTVNWLHETVPKLKAFEGEQPRTIDANDLTCYFKIKFFLPASSDNLDTTFERINRQNQGLDTKSWTIIRKTESEKGVQLIASIDMDAYDHLKKNRMRLFLNFGTIDVRYIGLLKGPSNLKQPEIETIEKENDDEDKNDIKVESA